MGIYTDRLAKVREAIDEILATGQSGSYAGRQWTYADLGTLRKLEKEYETAAIAETTQAKSRHRIAYFVPD